MAVKKNFNSRLPDDEIRVSFSRSSGAGGQNVNKTSTKVTAHWPVGRSRYLSSEEKARVRTKLANKINRQDELVVMAEAERSQPQNRAAAISHLRELVGRAKRAPKKRRATRPTKASKLRRMAAKKIRARTKAGRRSVNET
jgi:ribosome-associated protein